jgi:hypothetical protein
MQPDERDAGYLFDMLQFAREALAITADTPAEIYLADLRSRRALERTISREIAARRVLDVVGNRLPRLIVRLLELVPPAPADPDPDDT